MSYSCERRLGNIGLWGCLCQVVTLVEVYGGVVGFRETSSYYLFLKFPYWLGRKYKFLYFFFLNTTTVLYSNKPINAVQGKIHSLFLVVKNNENKMYLGSRIPYGHRRSHMQ